MQETKQRALSHYRQVLADAKKDSLDSVILDIARSANGLCESLKSNYRETVDSPSLYCCKCKETFEAEEALSEWSMEPHEFWGTSVQRETGISLCPFCGSDDLLDSTEEA